MAINVQFINLIHCQFSCNISFLLLFCIYYLYFPEPATGALSIAEFNPQDCASHCLRSCSYICSTVLCLLRYSYIIDYIVFFRILGMFCCLGQINNNTIKSIFIRLETLTRQTKVLSLNANINPRRCHTTPHPCITLK